MADYPPGTSVQIAPLSELETFRNEWKRHHPLQADQLAFAGHVVRVLDVLYYHGADELYSLEGIPGVWHEACLRSASADDRSPGSVAGPERRNVVPPQRLFVLAGLLLFALLAVSGLQPYDRTTWWLEVAPVLIATPVLAVTHKRYPLTTLAYVLIFVHATILIAGGAYTYARVPLGFWLQDLLNASRNPYDKIGHFAQGFVPALIARELLIRGQYIRTRAMQAFLIICIVLAISATYELIEWTAALALGQGADEFLGTQGDPWDTQSDMALALLGGLVSLLLLSGFHDRQLRLMNVPDKSEAGH